MRSENTNDQSPRKRNILSNRLLFSILIVAFFTAAGNDLYLRYRYMLGAPFSMWKPSFFLVAAFTAATFASALILIWSIKFRDFLISIRNTIYNFRWFAVICACIAINVFFIYIKQSEIFSGSYARLMLYVITIVFMSWLATASLKFIDGKALLTSLLLLAGTFQVLYNFQHVVDYPFSLYWSEGNRMWDYSARIGRSLYIIPPDKPMNAYIDIGRQSLWGIIFLLPQVSIVGMRFWNAVIFVVPGLILGIFLFKNEKKHPGIWFLLALWTFLFLNQGPIYSPLVLAAVLVAAARDMRLLPAMLLVALASYYARSSRITWTFAPAILAVITAVSDSEREQITCPDINIVIYLIKKWKRAIFLGLSGILGGFFLQDLLPMILSRFNQAQAEATPLSLEGIQEAGSRQPLLWDRLMPNPTNPEGIIPSLVVATMPLIILLIIFSIKNRSKDMWQAIIITCALLAFLIVGLIASVKIGGGSNLHNMDMFLIALVFVASLAWDSGMQNWISAKIQHRYWLNILLGLVVILPAARDMMQAAPLVLPSHDYTQAALSEIQKYIGEANKTGEVLFMDQRQLLTFGYISGVPLIPEYEKKRMMDMAMANDADYFEHFYQDIYDHRFSMIVNEPTWIRYQGEDYNFGNENDAWVYWVSIPLLCQYEPLYTYQDVGVQLLVPRKTPMDNEHIICPQFPDE